MAYALEQGLKVIPCVGETLEQREAGKTMDVITDQLKAIAGRQPTRSFHQPRRLFSFQERLSADL